MKRIYFIGMVFGIALMTMSPSWAGDPVPLPCDPKDCPPVDPCKINPDRCKDKGGPIKFDGNSRSELDQPTAGPFSEAHGGFKSEGRSDGNMCLTGERESMSPLVLADVQGCFDSCSSQAKTCLRGCDNISDNQGKASCYEGCRSGQESCRGRCQ